MKKAIILLFLFPVLIQAQNKMNYNIYSDLINERINRYGTEAVKLIVINDSLIIDRSLCDLASNMDYFKINENDPIYDSLPDFPKNAEIESLLTLVTAEVKLDIKYKLESYSFKINKSIKLIDNTDRIKLKKSKEYWTQFYKLYPNSFGKFYFSPVFYSGRLAAVFIQHNLGSLSGTGYLIIMQKNKDKWEICIPVMLWIS